MKTQRRFRPGFKRQVVEELLSGISFPAQIIRRYEISSGLLCHWKKQYAKGAFENPPDKTAALEERVRQLEQLVVKLTLENEFIKKAVQLVFECNIGEIIMQDMCVPRANLLGEEGKGMRIELDNLGVYRPTVGAAALGMAERALSLHWNMPEIAIGSAKN
jgi:transposase-like protein